MAGSVFLRSSLTIIPVFVRALPGRGHRRRWNPAGHLYHGSQAGCRDGFSPFWAGVWGALSFPPRARRRFVWNRIAAFCAGVVSGIAHYGNCFGVPTVGGEAVLEPCYQNNPLVNVFALGLARKDQIFYGRATGPGNPVLYVGAKTGRDGIHGASLLASSEFSSIDGQQKRPNVQVGDPFLEKLAAGSLFGGHADRCHRGNSGHGCGRVDLLQL